MDLTARLAAQIVDFIRDGQVPPGARLVERALADRLRVSRSPVRSALRALHSEGIVGTAEGGGYIALGRVSEAERLPVPATSEEEAYRSIAEDRLAGRLPDRITEAALVGQYRLTRAQLANVLRRIDGEGWIERLPGRGWAFQPLLASKQTYADGYRFRVVIEPAAILDARFEVNRSILERCRDHQQRLIDGEIQTIPNAMLLERNSELHQAVIACSRNPFYVDGLKRVDSLRRLMELGQSIDREYALTRCQDHLRLAELLPEERRAEASELMRRHLCSIDFESMLRER